MTPKIHRNKRKKHFLQNTEGSRDHYAKKHSNKVWARQYAIKAGIMAKHEVSPKILGWGYVCMYRIVRIISPWAIFLTSALNRGVG